MHTAPPRRPRSVALAVGHHCTFVALLWLAPFALSHRAQENDLFLINLFLCLPYALVGSTLVILGTSGFGLPRAAAVLLCALHHAGIVAALQLSGVAEGLGLAGLVPLVAADAVALMLLALIVAARARQLRTWLRALFAALAGAALVAVGYAALGGHADGLPPYANGAVVGVSLIVGALVAVAAIAPRALRSSV